MAISLVVLLASAGCGDKSPRREATTATNGNGSDTGSGCDSEAPSDSDATSDSSAPFLGYTNWDYSVSIVRADGTQRRTLGDDALDPSWSPDGSAVLSRNQTGELVLTDIGSGKHTTIDAHIEQSVISDVTWEPNGRRLAYSRLRPGDHTYRDLWIADTSGSASIAVEYASPIAWSPDGRWIAYRAESPPADPTSFSPPPQLPDGPKSGTMGGPLQVLEVASRAARQLSGDGFLPYGTGMQVWSPDSRFVAYWRSYPGGVERLPGDLFARDIESGRELAIGSFTLDRFPVWGSTGERDILDNLAIDPATDNKVELFPRPKAALAWSAGAGIAAVVEASSDGGRDLVILDLRTGARTVIQHSAVAISDDLEPGFQAAIRPDGRYVAYLGITESLPPSRFNPVPDAKVTVPLVVLDLTTGASTVVANVDFRPGVLAFSHDGQWLSVQRAGDPVSICVARADGSAPHRVAAGVTFGTFDYPDPWRPQ
jgi:dipeptidyl aminopeptidase/acylaminoacyl peptidase